MISTASQKVKEGKLVKVEVEYDEIIRRIKITGDFFLHPEDTLDIIEKSMIGIRKDVSMENVASKISRIMKAYDVQMVGIDPESLAMVIKEALK